MERSIKDVFEELDRARDELRATTDKYKRAEEKKNKLMEQATKTKSNFSLENTKIGLEIELNNERVKNQYLIYALG